MAGEEFVPRLDILPPAQVNLWPELEQVPAHFHLYGGTALALHLGHRQSVDFGFFAAQTIDPDHLLSTMPLLRDAEVMQKGPDTLDVTIDRDGPIKLSFFGVPALARLRPPRVCRDNGVQVASLLDLAGTKAAVIQQRSEAKDYLDVAAILADGRINLPTALGAARAIYGQQFNPQITLKALAYFGDGNLRQVPEHTRAFLIGAIRGVDPARLPLVSADRASHEQPRSQDLPP